MTMIMINSSQKYHRMNWMNRINPLHGIQKMKQTFQINKRICQDNRMNRNHRFQKIMWLKILKMIQIIKKLLNSKTIVVTIRKKNKELHNYNNFMRTFKVKMMYNHQKSNRKDKIQKIILIYKVTRKKIIRRKTKIQ